MVKMIATDLDGTLLNEYGVISEQNSEAIKKAQQLGIPVVVVTGRSYVSAKKLVDAVGITCPIIGLNGAQTFTEEGVLTKSIPMHRDIYEKVIEMCEQQATHFDIYTSKANFTKSEESAFETLLGFIKRSPHYNGQLDEARKIAERYIEFEEFKPVENRFTTITEDVTVFKVICFSPDDERLKRIRTQLQQIDDLIITASIKENLEFNSKDANKGAALAKFAAELQIPMEEVMAIGDNFNDVTMLQMAGRSVAMGNAEEEIKEMCHFVTKTNVEHGVAEAIEEMLAELE
ncbi:Cof-type HAD-IIB family hydrolase [Alkalihalobacterium bogoriense]|uniref:Cof-type HAD-IIB family hydrolase n=1 Tax=Alkalihalobacterium bogoriense TaxID=246272 RepID=UPI00047EDAF8|nr:Cof-type HAD-IIB family hydrolase [Alkalihalobacterium bogoriense]